MSKMRMRMKQIQRKEEEEIKTKEIIKAKKDTTKVWKKKPIVEKTKYSVISESIVRLAKTIRKERNINPVRRGRNELEDIKLYVNLTAKLCKEKGIEENKIFSLIKNGIEFYNKEGSDEVLEKISWLCYIFPKLVRGYNTDNINKVIEIAEEFKLTPNLMRDVVGAFGSIPYHWSKFITPANENAVFEEIKRLVDKYKQDPTGFGASKQMGEGYSILMDFGLYANAIYNSITRERLMGLIDPDPVMVVKAFVENGGFRGAYDYFDKLAEKKKKGDNHE